jgi:hypothetical protein
VTPSTPDGAADPNPQSSEPTPVRIDPVVAAERFATVKALAEGFAALLNTMRENADLAFRPKQRQPVVSPTDPNLELALVSMTNPSPKAAVTDQTAFEAWMRERYPEKFQTRDRLIGSTTDVIAALRAYVPEFVLDSLVTTEDYLPDWETKAVLTHSKGAGCPVGPGGETGEDAPPGITVETPHPTVQVRLTEDAVPHVMHAFRSGQLDAAALVSTPALPAA